MKSVLTMSAASPEQGGHGSSSPHGYGVREMCVYNYVHVLIIEPDDSNTCCCCSWEHRKFRPHTKRDACQLSAHWFVSKAHCHLSEICFIKNSVIVTFMFSPNGCIIINCFSYRSKITRKQEFVILFTTAISFQSALPREIKSLRYYLW